MKNIHYIICYFRDGKWNLDLLSNQISPSEPSVIGDLNYETNGNLSKWRTNLEMTDHLVSSSYVKPIKLPNVVIIGVNHPNFGDIRGIIVFYERMEYVKLKFFDLLRFSVRKKRVVKYHILKPEYGNINVSFISNNWFRIDLSSVILQSANYITTTTKPPIL